MFKKSFLTALLFSVLTISSLAEEAPNMDEIEELSPIAKCDEQYDKCIEKCGDSSPDECVDKCTEIADKCYDVYLSETDDTPPVEDTENEPESEAQEMESEVVSPEVD